MDGKKLVSDGLTKPLQGSLFQQFALRLGLHGSGLDQPIIKDPAVKKSEAENRCWEEKIYGKVKMMMTLGAALVSCTRPVVKACGALMIACGGQMVENEEKEVPKIRAFRVSGGTQYPVRPTGDHQRSQAANRGVAASSSGEQKESMVPQWWDLELLQKAPKGKDKWVIVQDRWLVRFHGEERRRSFQPAHKSCPVDVSQLHQKRYSLVFPCDDVTERRLREDTWTSTSTTWTMNYRWVGYTVFELKGPMEDQESRGEPANRSSQGEDEAREQGASQRRDYSHQENSANLPASSGTSMGASVTYAPIINVSVNVDGRRVTTSMTSPRRSQAPSLGSFELVPEEEEF